MRKNKNRYRRWYYTSYMIVVHKAYNYRKPVWLEKKRHKKIKKVIIIYSYTNYTWGVCISCFSRTYTPPRITRISMGARGNESRDRAR